MSRDVSNFSTDVIERARSVPVLVDFWAPWCAPCRVLKPVLEKLASEARWRWTLVIVHVDSHPELAEQFGIRGIPNLKLFHQGGIFAEFSGALLEGTVSGWLDRNLPMQ